ncbi:MAG: ATP-binding protein [Candidatus Micrarchaeota archaeon]|nr:ATP-binding protein [Candidatus Micrarchaeota archaeon]
MDFASIGSTAEVSIPKDPLLQIIGQDHAVKIGRLVGKQRRHLLLVGPPGTGKSMLAQAIASTLPKPKQEVLVLHNPEKPERPIVQVRSGSSRRSERLPAGEIIEPTMVPFYVSEKLGFRCRRCGRLSSPDASSCYFCGADKYRKVRGPFDDLLLGSGAPEREERVYTTRMRDGKEELVVFERRGDKIAILTQKELAKRAEMQQKMQFKVLLPLNRPNFVQATGASETELLGDVRHDPYGSHPAIGSLPYTRVVPGAVHEAHEGVLFIDELSSLGRLQRFILTAMQEKHYPISGRNQSSTGSSVRVDGVPADFILVAAANINDVHHILPPLRSRIIGNGYEVLMNTHMEDNEENRLKLVQFLAQEIVRDGRIPHADSGAIAEMIEYARKKAKEIDGVSGLTLRLRILSGAIKMAGDIAASNEKKFITAEDVRFAIENAKPIEEQATERYGSWYKASLADYGLKKERGGSEVG